MTIPAKALRDFRLPLLWQPDSDTSLLPRLSAKDRYGGYHGSLPLDGTLYAPVAVASPAPTKAVGRWLSRRQQIYSYESLTTSSPTSGRSLLRFHKELHPSTSPSIRSTQVGWITMTTTCWPAAGGSRSSLDAGQPITACAPISNTGDLAHLISAPNIIASRNDLWTGAGGAT